MQTEPPARHLRVLVFFGTPFLYGLERAVIGLFDGLRLEIDPLFLLTRSAVRHHLPVFDAVRAHGFRYALLSDFWSWPRLARPRSLRSFLSIGIALLLGNLDSLRAAARCDAIYLPNRFALCHGLLGCALIRLKGGTVVYDFHDNLERPSAVLRALHPLVTSFVAGSQDSADLIAAMQPFIPARKLVLIRRTIDPAPAPPPGGDVGLGEGRAIVFAGQVAPHKGVDVLVRAFAAIAAAHPEATLHLIGQAGDAAYERELRDLAAPLSSQVRFWGYREDATALVAGAFVCVQPSRPALHRESAGLAVLEAMAAGVPAVVFPSGALAEIVVHGETGLVCAPDTPECLASCLQTLLNDPALAARMGRAARARFEACYDPERSRPEWLHVLRSRR